MPKYLRLLPLILAALCLLPARGAAMPDGMTIKEHPEWKKFFDEHGVAGTAVVHSLKTGQQEVHDAERAVRPFTPAST